MRIVIIGAGGRLGAALARVYGREFDVTGFNHAQLDLGQSAQVEAALDSLGFDVLINCAALTNVDRCETEPAEAFRLNAEAPALLAEICLRKKARLIHISTDYVFDGESRTPYREESEAIPLSVYAESKLEGERRVLAVNSNHLVARVSWVFGPDRPSFVDWVMQQARDKDRVEAIDDKISTPSYTLDLAEMLQPFLVEISAGGMLHLANSGECSWREYGQFALDCCKENGVELRTEVVHPISLASMENFVARRPIYTVLSTVRFEKLTGRKPRDWHEAVAAYVRDCVKRV